MIFPNRETYLALSANGYDFEDNEVITLRKFSNLFKWYIEVATFVIE